MPKDQELLERFAPRLQYDAQDAFRAVDAATMTDNPPNLLRRAGGVVIAGEDELSLDTLADYPEGAEFEPGDHLAAGPDLLGDAVKLQRDYRHCVYGRVLHVGDWTWVQYWIWYYDNPKTFLGRGRHEGDWELVQIGLDGDEPKWVTCSQHGHGETRPWGPTVERAGDHPIVYVAPFSHANYFQAGTRYYFPSADHPTARGPRRNPDVFPFGAWEKWPGRWGVDEGMRLLGRPLRSLGGVSPDAPIIQQTRWSDPDRFARQARRPDRLALRLLKTAGWWIGKGSYPHTPELTSVTLAGRRLDVRWTLRQTWRRRTRDVLLTVHEPGADEIVVMSVVRRKRDARRGAASLYLPRPVDRCTVRVSAFNRLGQRSDSSDPVSST